mmetsp:Transcript_8026/g.12012  ORF Transcript_8026/g.12012 Transcript_8026/m.12012 type:complete len:743 (-) Transcript_8026:639-2867(-)
MSRKNRASGGGGSTGSSTGNSNGSSKQKPSRGNNDRTNSNSSYHRKNDSFDSIPFDPTNFIVDYSSSSSVRVTLFAAFVSLLIGAIFGASFASSTPSLGSTQQQHPFGVPTSNNNYNQGSQTYQYHQQTNLAHQQPTVYNNGNGGILAGTGGMTANVVNSGGANVVTSGGAGVNTGITTTTSTSGGSVNIASSSTSRQTQVMRSDQTAAQLIQQNLNAHFGHLHDGAKVHVHVNEVKLSPSSSTAKNPTAKAPTLSSPSSFSPSSSHSNSPQLQHYEQLSLSPRLSSTTAHMMMSSSSPSSWSSFSSSSPNIVTTFSSDGVNNMPSYSIQSIHGAGRDEINGNGVHLHHVTNLYHANRHGGTNAYPHLHSSTSSSQNSEEEHFISNDITTNKEKDQVVGSSGEDEHFPKPYFPQADDQEIISMINHNDPAMGNAVNPHHTTLPTVGMMKMNNNRVAENNGHHNEHRRYHEENGSSDDYYYHYSEDEHHYHNTAAAASSPGSLSSTNAFKPTVFPSLCSDGYTVGYSDWSTLRQAITETNDRMTELFLQWKDYYVAMVEYESVLQRYMENASHSHQYSESPPIAPTPPAEEHDGGATNHIDPFVICPDTTLRTPRHARSAPININAENIQLECDNCMIDVGGTHLSFGPHAKGILVKGITFKGAQTSSVTFHHHGAEVTFEDCYWIGNAGSGTAGAVADLNSTSSVTFSRCELSDFKQVPRAVAMSNGGYGVTSVSSSLTIRN